ncbi:EPIDERMAL PATTERNING FACTOR-like protein 4 [Juglans microcarpa x Juglans regia]|uniref:EPIDERMAL PATTERNING FACTOR-like protein 4 n=1 Tax=Juglans microcarpa x Juglans regia TaxID=2249226 RepID=UPI001B7E9804|nr:EPIDERMAL PATTERNING FACTOR-like protein 4 [Juglans microcarpa x Juglans regia]
MGALRHRHHHRCRVLQILAALTFLFLASATAISLSFLGSEGPGLQGTGERRKEGSGAVFERFGRSRRALGLGSSPPTCRSKCGMCLPCKPVHVPIHPGLSTPLEYYPEAWRCQCRNKLFMP